MPDELKSQSNDGASPFDLTVLVAQTGGDETLQRQILGLFLRQIPQEIARLQRSPSDMHSDIIHRIIGTARAVGADLLAKTAETRESPSGTRHDRIAAIEAAFAVTRSHIIDYLAD